MKEKIEAQLNELKAQREQFLRQAEQQIAFFNGQVAALEALLVPDPEPTNESKG